jgi:hypothetical protein
MSFRDNLLSTYSENPCQVLPNALWKTLVQLDNMQTSVKVYNGAIIELKISNENMLMMYWTRNREPSQDCFQQHDTLEKALIHQDYLHTFPSQRFPVRKPYFRLIHKGG